MITFFKRLLAEPSIEDQLKEFGGEEVPYSSLRKRSPEEMALQDGESIVFSGRPQAWTISCFRRSVHQALGGKKAEELALTITEKDGKYFWKSRSSRPLRHTQNGRFHYFAAESGGAYIKIAEAGHEFRYAEDFSYSMVSFIVWGESSALRIGPANQAIQPTPGQCPPSNQSQPPGVG